MFYTLEKKNFTALGLMSGTSLDGLDICCATFNVENHSIFYIHKTATIPYTQLWKSKLASAHLLSGLELMQLNHDFGVYCGNQINAFLETITCEIDFISSHGHTVFHSPSTGFTTQIGNGAAIYAQTGIKTIADFRSLDVALGGQGAPLVPIGDLLLFKNYQACLNLGGISNISIKSDNQIIAQDLGYCNLLLNYLTKRHYDLEYDKDGKLGRSGKIEPILLNQFLEFTNNKGGKSLAREDFETFLGFINDTYSKENTLRTSYEYIAVYLSNNLNINKVKEVLASGGGAHNTFLIELTQSKTETTIVLPNSEIIDFKEALIFAFLGLLRILNKENCLNSVTQASKNSIGGAIWGN